MGAADPQFARQASEGHASPTAWGDYAWMVWNEEVQTRGLVAEAAGMIDAPPAARST